MHTVTVQCITASKKLTDWKDLTECMLKNKYKKVYSVPTVLCITASKRQDYDNSFGSSVRADLLLLHHALQRAGEQSKHTTSFLPLCFGFFSHMTRRKKATFTTRLNGPWVCRTFFNTPNPLWATNCCSTASKLQSRTKPAQKTKTK